MYARRCAIFLSTASLLQQQKNYQNQQYDLYIDIGLLIADVILKKVYEKPSLEIKTTAIN
jgi:hypothetical protein